MEPFKSLMTDIVSIIKKDGSKFEKISASVQKNKISIFGSKILIETGDLIQRKMSNGGEETYEVIDPGFHEKFHGIAAGYQMDVRKLGLPEAEKAINTITYNISGHNTRINQNSIDNSTNVVILNQEVLEHIAALRREIDSLKLSDLEAKSAHEVVNAIESQFESQQPSKTVISTLLGTLPSVASIASIGSFLLSLL